jgi:hypothetical protein
MPAHPRAAALILGDRGRLPVGAANGHTTTDGAAGRILFDDD